MVMNIPFHTLSCISILIPKLLIECHHFLGYGPPGPGYGHYPPTGSSQRPPGPPPGSSDHYPSSAGGYPPPSYPPNASGPRGPSWPPQQTGFMGPPGGPPNGPAPPPSSSAHDMYNRQGWPQPSYGSPRPPYPGQNTPSHASGTGAIPASGPPSSNISRGPPAPPAQHPAAPSTGGNTSQGQPPFPGQSPYSDQYQVRLLLHITGIYNSFCILIFFLKPCLK